MQKQYANQTLNIFHFCYTRYEESGLINTELVDPLELVKTEMDTQEELETAQIWIKAEETVSER